MTALRRWISGTLAWHHILEQLPDDIQVVLFDVKGVEDNTDDVALTLRVDGETTPIWFRGWRLNDLVGSGSVHNTPGHVVMRLVETVRVLVQGRCDLRAEAATAQRSAPEFWPPSVST